VRIRFYEWAAGKLLVRSAKARNHRAALDDAHEMRHLFAAVTAGNSAPCDGGRTCFLDGEMMHRLHDANWPELP